MTKLKLKLKSFLKIRYNFTDFLNLFFPNLCSACGNRLIKGESILCSDCLYHLPRTGFHLKSENPTEELFRGLVHIEQATSFFFFSKGSKYRKLIHAFKYKGQRKIARVLGLHFGTELKNSQYNSVDLIVPVPLHPVKERKRGYNQSEMIVDGMQETLGKNVDYRKYSNSDQKEFE